LSNPLDTLALLKNCFRGLLMPFALPLVTAFLFAAQAAAPQAKYAGKPLIDPAVVAHADGVERDNPKGFKEAYLPILYPSAHASNLYQLRNGDLLCVWFSGTWEGNSGVGIVVSRLPKGGKQWGPTKLIDRRDGESFQNPTVFQSPDGVVHVYHTTQPANGPESSSKVLQVMSKDNGETWSAPQEIFTKGGSYTRHPPLFLADGKWLLPMTYVTSAGIGEGAETNYPAMEISSDKGATWKECLFPDANAKVQPTTVQLGPQKFVTFFRDRASNWIFKSTSTDGCKWTVPVATQLPNNNASVQAVGLRNGHIAMVFDNSHADRSGPKPIGGLRKPLSIALSEDGGETWKSVRDIETGRPGYGADEGKPKEPGREEYSYPTVYQTTDGRIHVAFTYRRQTIKEVSFAESWVAQGTSEGIYRSGGR
jgi:predicted neuraminidase